MLEATALLGLLAGAEPFSAPAAPRVATFEPTWRERLWTVPPETRIGVRELAEALGRPKSWVYRRTAPHGERAPLPHRKLDGELVFIVGEIRGWLPDHETVVAEPVHLSQPAESAARGRRA